MPKPTTLVQSRSETDVLVSTRSAPMSVKHAIVAVAVGVVVVAGVVVGVGLLSLIDQEMVAGVHVAG